jgi:hypothetical protein
MLDVNLCPECKVPEPFNQGQVWLNNGDIVQRVNQEARIAFTESENLDPLFRNIGNIIGVSIERLLINITARGVEGYMKQLIPTQVREMIQAKELEPKPFMEPIVTYCHIVGFGNYEYIDSRYEGDEDDFYIQRIREPFSVPEAAGSLAGAISSVVGGEHAVTYEKISTGLYEFRTHWTEYSQVLKDKMVLAPYKRKDGDIELERCATCGVPKALRGYRWYLDNGIIINEQTGRRMAVLGPELLDRVFEALESELGDTIPDVVVEAQRRFVKTGFYDISEVANEDDFRVYLAVRGLGNLREMALNANGMSIRIDNAAGHLLVVGMVQGLFEMAFGADSYVEWELSQERNLDVAVGPRKAIASMSA